MHITVLDTQAGEDKYIWWMLFSFSHTSDPRNWYWLAHTYIECHIGAGRVYVKISRARVWRQLQSVDRHHLVSMTDPFWLYTCLADHVDSVWSPHICLLAAALLSHILSVVARYARHFRFTRARIACAWHPATYPPGISVSRTLRKAEPWAPI